ncbi:hypothetical protein [Acidianus brierleyi]|nr:hypothetical protein [Acidianus brierleyi]
MMGLISRRKHVPKNNYGKKEVGNNYLSKIITLLFVKSVTSISDMFFRN